jgi:hypothetical protein
MTEALLEILIRPPLVVRSSIVVVILASSSVMETTLPRCLPAEAAILLALSLALV